MYRHRRRCRRRSRRRCRRRRRRRNRRRRLGAFRRDGPVEDPVAGDEEVGAVGSVDHLEGVDGHLVEGDVDFLGLLDDDGPRRNP
jgi:hypothetical protein